VSTELGDLQLRLRAFYDARDWTRFQTLKDVAASTAIEAGELQELFLWRQVGESEAVLRERRADVEAELADVMINCLNFARLSGIDLIQAVERKLDALDERYPVDDVRGRVVAKPA